MEKKIGLNKCYGSDLTEVKLLHSHSSFITWTAADLNTISYGKQLFCKWAALKYSKKNTHKQKLLQNKPLLNLKTHPDFHWEPTEKGKKEAQVLSQPPAAAAAYLSREGKGRNNLIVQSTAPDSLAHWPQHTAKTKGAWK